MIPGMGVHKYKSVPIKSAKRTPHGVGFAMLILSHYLKYLTETKLFHFHKIFNSGEGGANPLWICHCNALPITYLALSNIGHSR